MRRINRMIIWFKKHVLRRDPFVLREVTNIHYYPKNFFK